MRQLSENPVVKAMVLAAGLGTRLQPFTRTHPKALAQVNGKTLLEWNIRYLQQFGIRNVVVNVHHFADQIIQTIQAHQGWGSILHISDETEQVLETGGGLYHARKLLEDCDALVVMNVDILTNLDLQLMLAQHIARQSAVTLAVTDRVASRYFLFNQRNRLCGWRNQTTGEEKLVLMDAPLFPKAFSGIQIINPAMLQHLPGAGKYSLVDVYLQWAPNYLLEGFNHTGDTWIDVGTPATLAAAERLFASPDQSSR
ncbi:nucleotidyltransferase family protein [Hydrotalea sandarakina]|jgi:NDP-sugar pyrophosphorylase family protein|uniref:Nucleotidyltransferase-like protein n=1 Tax=Hydrotalea sandarakina TaxID=1004304 RepID=A0A2W7RPJ9_9BACT|nr:nucleotidyltransferase family protein [Hydrotalea sandarakina]PZX62284.1 nucleotidyltransferase-like protein [Hydrotalea sandarakina]